MLVLSRKRGEVIELSDGVRITLVGGNGFKARIGIEAPPEIKIVRQEIAGRVAPPDANVANGKAADAAVA
jgi:carbon storage regulator